MKEDLEKIIIEMKEDFFRTKQICDNKDYFFKPEWYSAIGSYTIIEKYIDKLNIILNQTK